MLFAEAGLANKPPSRSISVSAGHPAVQHGPSDGMDGLSGMGDSSPPDYACLPSTLSRVRTKAFVQRLPALELSIERYTDAVPDDGAWYLLCAGDQLARFKTYKAAKDAWDEFVSASGWKPERRQLDPKEYLIREATMRENERWHEYWGSSHKFRAKGGVHKNR